MLNLNLNLGMNFFKTKFTPLILNILKENNVSTLMEIKITLRLKLQIQKLYLEPKLQLQKNTWSQNLQRQQKIRLDHQWSMAMISIFNYLNSVPPSMDDIHSYIVSQLHSGDI